MRTKNPRFINIYRGSWYNPKFVSILNGPYDTGKHYGLNFGWGSSLFRLAFAGNKKANLPRNIETLDANVTDETGTLHVHLILKPFVPSTKRGSWGRVLHNSNHRVFIMCDRCDHMIPAGRIHQHTC